FYVCGERTMECVRTMNERVSFRRSALPGVTVLSARASSRLWKYTYDTLCITIVRDGTGAWSNRGKSYEIGASKLMVMQPGDLHRTTAVHGPASFDALFIQPSLVDGWFGQSLSHHSSPVLGSSVGTPALLSAFRAVLDNSDWQVDSGHVSEALTT